MLRPSVITSSSSRVLSELMRELSEIGGTQTIDLMILRETDLEELAGDDPPDAQSFMSRDDNWPIIRDWARSHCRGFDVAALATYFPDITSLVTGRREAAIQALVQTVRLALDLAQRPSGREDTTIMQDAVVELVCGSRLEMCPCTSCDGQRVFEWDVEQKIQVLMESLEEVIRRVYDGAKNTPRFALALELEPGSIYVLRDLESLRMVRDAVHSSELLSRHVGFNLDIAHMRIAQISAEQIASLGITEMIAHAHICDTPGMHTRDQPLGMWTSFERRGGGHYPYLHLLASRATDSAANKLPFSGAVALELEGCNRMSWIYRSLPALRHLLRYKPPA